jgi:hypothetical protein
MMITCVDLQPSIMLPPAGATYVSTDPRMSDTDMDGMGDFYEMFHGLNPLLGTTLPMPAEVIAHFGSGNVTAYTYTVVTPEGTENPVTEGWYVRYGNDFIKSTDTTVINGTVYFEKTEV